MSAATFACPHCGQHYPLKPVLIDKIVRCTACKQAFKLRPDGIADKVETVASTTSTLAAPALAAPGTGSETGSVQPSAGGDSAAKTKTSTATISRSGGKTLTQRQIEARRQMAESLRAAVGDALKDEEFAAPANLDLPGKPKSERTAKPGGPGGERPISERKPTSSFLKPKDPKLAGKGPAVLTGEGEREAANDRRWWLTLFITLVVVAGLFFAVTRTGGQTAALQAFTEVVPAKDNRYGARLEAIQARAWQPQVAAFIDLPSPRLSSIREIPGATLDQALAPLQGLTWVPTAKRWTAPDKVDWLLNQLKEEPKNLATRIDRAGIVVVSADQIERALTAASLSEAEVALIQTLLTSPLGLKLRGGTAPTIRWCSLNGRDGTVLFDPGQGYKTRTTDYQGILAQFQGEGWPSEWRIATMEPANR